jgi:linoleoyl-CoA desaturase
MSVPVPAVTLGGRGSVLPATGSPSARPPTPSPKFTVSDRFLHALRHKVDAYFQATGRKKRDCPCMYFKTATILAWFFGAYFLLLFVAWSWWNVLPLAVILGLGLAAVGFNIQHDGGHQAYSNSPWINKLSALMLELIGGSSYIWDWKHNAIHHTYTNITDEDQDINLGFLARLSPYQRRYWFHRLQGIYLWILYGFLAIKWHFIDDFYYVASGRVGNKRIPRPTGKDLVIFIVGKTLFFSFAFVVPLLLHRVWTVLGTYAIASFVAGLVLAVTFQLAHCVEGAEFPMPTPDEKGRPVMETGWAVHQVQTTFNFSRGNWLLCWYVGGLNHQIEHHLFPRICHVNYPMVAKVVEAECREFGLRYAVHRSLFSAIAAHYRWLVAMGRSHPLPASA